MYDRIKAKKLETNVDGIEMIYNRLHSAQQDINIDDQKVVETLQKGDTFLKYGRKGKPKNRLVYFSKDDLKIYWRAPNNKNESPRYIKINRKFRIHPYFALEKRDSFLGEINLMADNDRKQA